MSAPKPKFQLGQIVRLASGGPDMTIEHIRPSNSGEFCIYKCSWFNGAILNQASFNETVLIPVDKK